MTDFATGSGGDRLDITAILNGLTGFTGENPFSVSAGYLRLVQDGADTLFEVDITGGGDGFVALYRLQNTTATDFTSANFLPAYPPDGTAAAGLTITGTPGNDTGATEIAGTVGDDNIDALAGNDTVRADAGNDLVLGGAGFDTLLYRAMI